MKQYLDLLQNIIDNGIEKESGRDNMPNTIGISNGIIKMNLQDGFPLLTTKKMFLKGIIYELLWILRGETNVKYLVDNNVNIWNGDAYRWYLKWWDEKGSKMGGLRKLETIEEFIEQIKQESNCDYDSYTIGDLGKVYGYQWRRKEKVFNDEQAPDYENKIEIIDQVKDCIESLQKNPYSRYHIIDAWDKADFKDMALAPCHLLYQFIVRPMTFDQRHNEYARLNNGMRLNFDSIERVTKAFDEMNIPKFYLDLNMYQRSCDTALGVPTNIASMSLLLMIFAKTCNMISGVATWIGGDTHLYVNHLDVIKEQLKREPYKLPKLKINKKIDSLEDILNLNINDFELIDYKSHSKLKFELFVGLKK